METPDKDGEEDTRNKTQEDNHRQVRLIGTNNEGGETDRAGN